MRTMLATLLEQLSSMTTLSIDSGDLAVIEEFAQSGCISDATTNPLFVAQAGQSGDPLYTAMVDESVASAVKRASVGSSLHEITDLAMDTLAVTLGARISALVPGYVSTEVDPRLSFDVGASVVKGRRIISLYKERNIPKSRILIKLAATWEGIQAAKILEAEGITCNLTLIFSVTQAIACGQADVRLISPFPGRVLDWHNARRSTIPDTPSEDEGVMAVTKMHSYYRAFNHKNTILMPASWRPSRGTSSPDFMLDEIRALAGVDRMTIPAPLLQMLQDSTDPLPRMLHDQGWGESSPLAGEEIAMDENTFRYMMTMDGCGNDKLGEGLRNFCDLTDELEEAIRSKVETKL
ncbi:hypothetical protein TrRE_jg7831 [Triparma retinervis]|uniref:Transaldolase n=1 Tax=Triparma retinervis TaxID=2557542 RepID=A0A9W7FIS6_9STRA|nr:hypothetical protein TrRE_jg7831 [Triparma retinervis]